MAQEPKKPPTVIHLVLRSETRETISTKEDEQNKSKRKQKDKGNILVGEEQKQFKVQKKIIISILREIQKDILHTHKKIYRLKEAESKKEFLEIKIITVKIKAK